ncbi:MAG: hypothetical protein PHT40_01900 [Patescibacteria group bacterium]|nr:hypothetical protein [Patescibacteria group bacterium]
MLDKFDIDMAESRKGRDRFHWYLATLSAATLALVIKFVSEINPINDLVSICYIKISLWCLVGTIILSPIRNLLSYDITSLIAQYEDTKNENYWQRAKQKTYIRNLAGEFSIILYLTAIIMLVLSCNELFL